MVVSVPQRCSLVRIHHFLADKQSWIAEKQALARQRLTHQNTALPAWDIITDTHIMLYGHLHQIHVQPGLVTACHPGKESLHVTLRRRSEAEPEKLRNIIESWLKQTALTDFAARCASLAARIGVTPGKLRLSTAKTRWGSCSRFGDIALNWKLIHAAPEIIDYVILHELCHIRHFDHSPAFWSLVAQHMPDYKTRQAQLKHLSLRK